MPTARDLTQSIKANLTESQKVAISESVTKFGLGTGIGTASTVVGVFGADNLNSANLTGTYSFTAETTDTPTSLASFVIHNERTYTAGQSATQLVPGKNNRLYYRVATGGGTSRTWGSWVDVVCVEKWTSGNSWYRVYSDGFIEQGGQTSAWSSNPDTAITLHKAFTKSVYSVSCINIGTSKDSYTGDVCLVSTSTTSFTINCHTNNRGGLNWYACGY